MDTADQSSQFYSKPASTMWQISREQALLLAGGRVLLMQIAHPKVAEAVYHHSYVFQKPLLRLQRTMQLTRTLVFGTKNEVATALAEIEQAHRPAVGRLEEAVGQYKAGEPYNARNPRQGLWVFATLVEGALHAYEMFVAPLEPHTKQAYYADCTIIADLMRIPESYLPDDYCGLRAYMQQAVETGEVAVSAKARQIVPFLGMQSVPILRYFTYPGYRLSIAMLPDPIREQYGFIRHDWEDKLIARFAGLVRTVIPAVPGIIRFAPEYRHALKLLNRPPDGQD